MMKILGHIHTYNESQMIDRIVDAVLGQSYPVDRILLVDNASTDGTLNRVFPDRVTVIRFEQNLLTSAPIIAAMEYARGHGYDWVWVLDGDSAPRRDALEKVMQLYESFDSQLQESVWLLASLPVDATTKAVNHGFRITPMGLKIVRPPSEPAAYECDAVIWSGSLYKLTAVEKVGLPRADYAMDIAEIEYGYRGRQHGYRAFMHQGSILDHNLGGPSLTTRSYHFGPVAVRMMELQPYRCYYVVRNILYFWLYDYHAPTAGTYAYCILKVAKMMMSFLLRPISHSEELRACVRGVRDAVSKNMTYRFVITPKR